MSVVSQFVFTSWFFFVAGLIENAGQAEEDLLQQGECPLRLALRGGRFHPLGATSRPPPTSGSSPSEAHRK